MPLSEQPTPPEGIAAAPQAPPEDKTPPPTLKPAPIAAAPAPKPLAPPVAAPAPKPVAPPPVAAPKPPAPPIAAPRPPAPPMAAPKPPAPPPMAAPRPPAPPPIAATKPPAPPPAAPPAPPAPIQTQTMADLYLSQGHFDKAVPILESLLAADPTSAQLREKLIDAKQQAVMGSTQPGFEDSDEEDEQPPPAGQGKLRGLLSKVRSRRKAASPNPSLSGKEP
jgi:hypothetical protein